MARILEFKSAGKTTVTLEANFLRIKRKGLLNLTNHGMDGEKSIDINNISGVQMKKAGVLTNGYIQFVILGSRESKGGLIAATKDENTIMFAKKEQKLADEIKEYVEEILKSKHQKPITVETKTDVSEEVRKFKALLDDGIITEEEFNQKKKQLLGL